VSTRPVQKQVQNILSTVQKYNLLSIALNALLLLQAVQSNFYNRLIFYQKVIHFNFLNENVTATLSTLEGELVSHTNQRIF